MKISQSKVRVQPFKTTPAAEKIPGKVMTSKAAAPVKKSFTSRPLSVRPVSGGDSGTNETMTSLHRIRKIALQELELIRRMKAEAVKYQQETAMKARSEAHQLVLHARLATQREIEDIIRQANEEIHKVLADIRVIRITAQEELAAQRKFTDAAKLNSMSSSMKEVFQKSLDMSIKKKKLVTIKD
ncbi:MAG: hypothetical protein A2Y89_01250 [Chloroflexi bacterium RBG_13_51_18]|nr:MAG: hypothetical protein A2Y89_01250 [Chloroflexi bacterium RBG_13_51_18]